MSTVQALLFSRFSADILSKEVIVDFQITLIFFIVASVIGLAYGIRLLERRKLEVRIETLESKLQLAQNRAGEMHERLVQAQAELLQLNSSLIRERTEKDKLIEFALKPWQRLHRGLIVAMLLVGLGSGIYIGTSETQKAYLVRMTQLEVSKYLAEDRLKNLETQFRELKDEISNVQEILKVETEARVMAETQLAQIKGEEIRPNPLHRLSAAFLPWKKEEAAPVNNVVLPSEPTQTSKAA